MLNLTPHRLILTIFSILFIPLISSAQEREIVAKLTVALKDCGKDVPEPSVRTIGSMKADNLTVPFTMYYRKPNTRYEFTVQNASFINVATDSFEWDYNPFSRGK